MLSFLFNEVDNINFELWTQKFAGTTNNLDGIHLNTYLSSKLEWKGSNLDFYPDKLRNLQGRTLRLGALTYMPYISTTFVVSNKLFH